MNKLLSLSLTEKRDLREKLINAGVPATGYYITVIAGNWHRTTSNGFTLQELENDIEANESTDVIKPSFLSGFAPDDSFHVTDAKIQENLKRLECRRISISSIMYRAMWFVIVLIYVLNWWLS